MGLKPLRIRFDKINRFIRVRGGEFRNLVLFNHGLFDNFCDNISGIADSINPSFGEIRINSYNSLRIEKTLTFHNVVILITSVVNKNKNKCYYYIFLEKKIRIKINSIHDIFK